MVTIPLLQRNFVDSDRLKIIFVEKADLSKVIAITEKCCDYLGATQLLTNDASFHEKVHITFLKHTVSPYHS